MSTSPLVRNMCPYYLGSQHNHNNNAKAWLGWLHKSVTQTKFIVSFVIMPTSNKKIISKIVQIFSSYSCTTEWIILSNKFGTPPLYFQMFIFLAILLPCSTAHHVLFLHNFGTKSHLYQLFPLVEELLERYGFTAIFKNGIDMNIVFYIYQMVMISLIITKLFFVESLVKILKPNEM